MNIFKENKTIGFSLVEVVVVSALITLVFGGLLAGIQYSLQLVGNSKAKLSALSIANDRMEFFRSLPYDNVGTIAGIPPGTISQNSTSSLNGIEFTERVLVEYIDDPADGQLTATTTDNNGIPSDYKRVKIEISWTLYDDTSNISLVSNIVPRSIETTVGGGTVRVNVIDADSSFLAGASVQLINTATTPTISINRLSGVDGTALFSGAPAASNYEVIVTAPGYSTDRTYVPNSSNPNPATSPFSVLESDISTVTFQIGELSDMNIKTLDNRLDGNQAELFFDAIGIATSTDTTIVADRLVLTNVGGVYESTGIAYLAEVVPTSIVNWRAITVAADTPGDTEYLVQLFNLSGGTYTLIPDSQLPGNSSGFVGPLVDISALDAGAYTRFAIGITLATTNGSVTPEIDEIITYYRSTETPRTNMAINMRGNKVIGTIASVPVYKYNASFTTSASTGEVIIADLEFDSYTITTPDSVDIVSACPGTPVLHQAGVDSMVEFVYTSDRADSARVTVINGFGQPIPGATVSMTRPGYSDSIETDTCGQAFFGSGVTAEADYVITVSKPGYTAETVNPFNISGDATSLVIMTPL